MILISKYIVPKGFVGIAIYPFIFLKQAQLKDDEILVNHEKIHLKQQRELLVVFYFPLYFMEWLFNLCRYRDTKKAYQKISFEKEAYQNEHNLQYLKTRKHWTFIKHL